MKKFLSLFLLLALSVSMSACQLGAPNVSDRTDQAVSDWRVFEDKDDNVRFKYRGDLAYKVDNESGYELQVGFSEGAEARKVSPEAYPIEFAIVSQERESEYVNGHKYISGFKKEDKYYYFSTTEIEKYSQTIDKMAETLEFTE